MFLAPLRSKSQPDFRQSPQAETRVGTAQAARVACYQMVAHCNGLSRGSALSVWWRWKRSGLNPPGTSPVPNRFRQLSFGAKRLYNVHARPESRRRVRRFCDLSITAQLVLQPDAMYNCGRNYCTARSFPGRRFFCPAFWCESRRTFHHPCASASWRTAGWHTSRSLSQWQTAYCWT